MTGVETKVIILIGPPGSGKGTQAQIISDKLKFFNFETSKIIEKEIDDHKDSDFVKAAGRKYNYGKERAAFRNGFLNSPPLVAFWIKKNIRALAKSRKPIVFSGSPRTVAEAKELIPLIEKSYGRKSLKVILINISERESVFRNSHRRICQICRTPVPYLPETKKIKKCPVCGGKLIRRVLDKPEVIKVRFREYKKRTLPVLRLFKNSGYYINEIDGMAGISEVAGRIREVL